MATSTNIVNTLGAGSGIDIKTLAQNLVEAERTPRKQQIDDKIKKSEAKISGFSAVKYSLSELKTAFEKLNDANDFSSIQVNNSQSSAFSATASTSAVTGSYSVKVNAVALAQRMSTNGFAERSTQLNGGNAFDLSLSVGSGAAQSIHVSTDTPAGIVGAINGAGKGITAQLISTGGATPWKIVVTGQTGASQTFTLDSGSVNLGLPAADTENPGQTLNGGNLLQSARDASIEVNGLAITSASNTLTDILDGVTLDLYTETTGTARLDLNRETTSIKDNLKALVNTYNDFQDTLKILGDSKSTVQDFGGALAGESLLQNLRNQIRGMVVNTSSTPGTTIKAARDVGLSVDRYGKLQLDETALDKALSNNFSEVVTMFSAGTNNKSVYSSVPAGVAGSAIKKLDEMLRSTGMLALQTQSTQKQIDKYQKDLIALEDRMQQLLDRYTKQFSVMDDIVSNSTATRASLTSTFSAMNKQQY